jgi:16S rRNA G966 N2-methylase RsmD
MPSSPILESRDFEKSKVNLNKVDISKFLSRIRNHERLFLKYKTDLDSSPSDWKTLLPEIHTAIDRVFDDCLLYEQYFHADQMKLKKAKAFFITNFRKYFRLGKFNSRVIDKPFGYAGDFLIIDDIYTNTSEGEGLGRIWDEYFLKTAASIATRNRKEDFKRIVHDFASRLPHKEIKVLDLASGPAREWIEFNESYPDLSSKLKILCVDHDQHSIDYAQKILKESGVKLNITFLKKDAIRLALSKDPKKYLDHDFHIIYSTGLFDYLPDDVAARLIKNLKILLVEAGGLLTISNYTEAINNPSRLYMEWGGDWDLIYRSEQGFCEFFKLAGFDPQKIKMKYEPLKVMQYCLAQT